MPDLINSVLIVEDGAFAGGFMLEFVLVVPMLQVQGQSIVHSLL